MDANDVKGARAVQGICATRRPTVVISPLRASGPHTIADNIRLAHDLALRLAHAGFAPFAPHGYYTAFLDDLSEIEREIGMDCGKVWLARAMLAVVYTVRGISSGMKSEIELCAKLGKPVFFLDDASAESLTALVRRVEQTFRVGGRLPGDLR